MMTGDQRTNTPLFVAPRYMLRINGFASPTLMRRKGAPFVVEVIDPRKIIACDTTFILDDAFRDLPVGQSVQIGYKDRFYACLVSDLDKEEAERKARHAAKTAHLENHYQTALLSAREAVSTLLANHPTQAQLLQIITDSDKLSRKVYHLTQKAKYGTDAQKREAEEAAERAKASQHASCDMIDQLMATLRQHNIILSTAYAYSQREGARCGAHMPGGQHCVTHQTLTRKLWVREPDDALCKPRRQFWGLEPLAGKNTVNCARCLTLLFRLYIDTVEAGA